MRRSVLLVSIVFFFLTVTPALSANIGPVKPAVPEGDILFGLGYMYSDSRWEDGGTWEGLEMQQNLFFGHAGLRFSKNWFTYLRGGISTLDADDAFLSGGDFEGEDVVPFISGGVNGVFYDNGTFAIGPYAQGTYYLTDVDDSRRYSGIIDSATGFETIEETVTFDEMWEVRAGMHFQIEMEGAQLYAGPMYYITEADIESRSSGLTSGVSGTVSKTVEEEDNFGFVAGVQWQLLDDLSLEFETQIRKAMDFGLVLNKRF